MLGTQAPNAVMMVRPIGFRFNPETAASNAFQQVSGKQDTSGIRSRAVSEFTHLVETLRSAGVEVMEFLPESTLEAPDAVFPNNWISTHHDGKVILYPMLAPSRRLERRPEYITALEKQYGFLVKQLIDLSHYENQDLFLEGTGSLVIDYQNQVIYANHSARTSRQLVAKVAEILNCSVCQFYAVDQNGQDIYHTNVLMCVGEGFAVVCLEALKIPEERARLEASLQSGNLKVVAISMEQMNHFAGNMMQLRNTSGEPILAMSSAAHNCLREDQKATLSKYARLVHAPIDTIEKFGGGSVRCMLAGIFLPRRAGDSN